MLDGDPAPELSDAAREFRQSGLDPSGLRRQIRSTSAKIAGPVGAVDLADSRLRVGVLPLVVRHLDPAIERGFEGFLEDAIHALSRFHGLRLASLETVLPFRGRIEDPREIGAALGADYLIGGSLAGSGKAIEVRYRIVEASTGDVLSSGDFSVEEAQPTLARAAELLVLHCTYHLTHVARLRAKATPLARRRAVDHYLVGLSLGFLDEPRDYVAALDAFERALDLQPDLGRAAAYAGWAAAHLPISSERDRGHILERAHHAVSSGAADAEALAIAAWTLVHVGHDFDAALAAADRAVRLNPLNRVAWSASAWVRAMRGEYETPMRHWEAAERCNPFRMGIDQTFGGRAICCLLAGKLEAARRWAKACIDHAPSHPAGHIVAVAGAVEVGDEPAARSAAEVLLQRFPQGAAEPVIVSIPLRQREQKERLLAAVERGVTLAQSQPVHGL